MLLKSNIISDGRKTLPGRKLSLVFFFFFFSPLVTLAVFVFLFADLVIFLAAEEQR